MSSLASVLQNHYPAGEALGDHLDAMASEQLEAILDDLPRRESLPMPDELADVRKVTRQCPVVIEEAVSVKAIRRHLLETRPDTPEFAISIFPNGTQVLEVGTAAGMDTELAWRAFQKQSVIDFHTHTGGPAVAQRMREPSIRDVDATLILDQPIAIGSYHGLTHVSKPNINWETCAAHTLWWDYICSRGFDEAAYYEYGADRTHSEFIADVIKPSYIGWNALNGESSLAETILAQRASSIS